MTMTNYDACAAIEGFDGMEHDEAEMLDAWQSLIDSGAAWTLQGFYGRHAAYLIDTGVCHAAS